MAEDRSVAHGVLPHSQRAARHVCAASIVAAGDRDDCCGQPPDLFGELLFGEFFAGDCGRCGTARPSSASTTEVR